MRRSFSPTAPILLTHAQCILRYYTEKDVAGKDGVTWETVVGYDLLDSFYQG